MSVATMTVRFATNSVGWNGNAFYCLRCGRAPFITERAAIGHLAWCTGSGQASSAAPGTPPPGPASGGNGSSGGGAGSESTPAVRAPASAIVSSAPRPTVPVGEILERETMREAIRSLVVDMERAGWQEAGPRRRGVLTTARLLLANCDSYTVQALDEAGATVSDEFDRLAEADAKMERTRRMRRQEAQEVQARADAWRQAQQNQPAHKEPQQPAGPFADPFMEFMVGMAAVNAFMRFLDPPRRWW